MFEKSQSDVHEFSLWIGGESDIFKWRHTIYAELQAIGTVIQGPHSFSVELRPGLLTGDNACLNKLLGVPGTSSPDREYMTSGPISVRWLCPLGFTFDLPLCRRPV